MNTDPFDRLQRIFSLGELLRIDIFLTFEESKDLLKSRYHKTCKMTQAAISLHNWTVDPSNWSTRRQTTMTNDKRHYYYYSWLFMLTFFFCFSFVHLNYYDAIRETTTNHKRWSHFYRGIRTRLFAKVYPYSAMGFLEHFQGSYGIWLR